MNTQALTITTPLEQVMVDWLQAKSKKTDSKKTEYAYGETLARFRLRLQQQGLDLPDDPKSVRQIAEDWAGRSWIRQEKVKPATYNQRMAILSSFYQYAMRHAPHLVKVNPISLAERKTTQEYASAHPLDLEDVKKRLAEIKRETLVGARDYALLLVALTTGRRAAEIAALCKETTPEGQKVIRRKNDCLVLHFKHCKGAKVMDDLLSPEVSAAVLEWITMRYGSLEEMPNGAPLWPVLDFAQNTINGKQRTIRQADAPMGVRGISYLCKRHLGTSKVHATRHTFAHAMEEAGAKVSDIADRLGHSNVAITGRYLKALKSEVNPKAGKLAEMLGLR